MYTYIHIFKHIHIYVYIHIYTCVYIFTHTNTYIYIQNTSKASQSCGRRGIFSILCAPFLIVFLLSPFFSCTSASQNGVRDPGKYFQSWPMGGFLSLNSILCAALLIFSLFFQMSSSSTSANGVRGPSKIFSKCVCGSVCCSVLQCVAVCCSLLQCVAVCCSVLQCVAVCCSVLQCVYFQSVCVCGRWGGFSVSTQFCVQHYSCFPFSFICLQQENQSTDEEALANILKAVAEGGGSQADQFKVAMTMLQVCACTHAFIWEYT